MSRCLFQIAFGIVCAVAPLMSVHAASFSVGPPLAASRFTHTSALLQMARLL